MNIELSMSAVAVFIFFSWFVGLMNGKLHFSTYKKIPNVKPNPSIVPDIQLKVRSPTDCVIRCLGYQCVMLAYSTEHKKCSIYTDQRVELIDDERVSGSLKVFKPVDIDLTIATTTPTTIPTTASTIRPTSTSTSTLTTTSTTTPTDISTASPTTTQTITSTTILTTTPTTTSTTTTTTTPTTTSTTTTTTTLTNTPTTTSITTTAATPTATTAATPTAMPIHTTTFDWFGRWFG